jgi:hypothetical protein
MLATSEPWPVSVIAKQPGMSRFMMPGSHLAWCSSVPRCITADPNSPHWTPALICRDGSAVTSSSKPAMLPPWSSAPPSAAWEGAVDSFVVHEDLQLPESARAMFGVCQAFRFVQLGAARQACVPACGCPDHLPRSCSPRAATSTAGWALAGWVREGVAAFAWPAGRSTTSVMSYVLRWLLTGGLAVLRLVDVAWAIARGLVGFVMSGWTGKAQGLYRRTARP